jgi:uncharacterized spore protein YtfJ
MDPRELLAHVTDHVTVSRVFGAPIPQGEALVIPVASVRGAAGGGSGAGPSNQGSGSGGGGGFVATPAGVYVIQGGVVHWHPALDVTRIVLGGQVVAVALALVARSIVRRRRR